MTEAFGPLEEAARETAAPRRIIWDKWVDPILAAVKEHRERGWHDSYEYLDRPGQVGVYQGPFMGGPAGIIPLNELNAPSKNFNLWVGHASFHLSRPVLLRMARVPGVEILKVWTPYRFWLGVGRAFEEREVKAAVLEAACPRPRRAAPLDGLKRQLSARHKAWAIFSLPDGRLDAVGGDGPEEVMRLVRERSESPQRLITSWGAGRETP